MSSLLLLRPHPGRLIGSLRVAVAVAVVVMGMVLAADDARAEFGIELFEGLVADQQGASYTQAAGHPHSASTTIEFPALSPLAADGSVRDTFVDLPPGLIGNPEAIPGACRYEVLVAPNGTCPIASQVGTARIKLGPTESSTNLYELTPSPGAPARFGFLAQGVPVVLIPEVRGDDYGLTVAARDISQALPVMRVAATFWGVPADPSHDGERGFAPLGHSHAGQLCARAASEGSPCDNPAGYEPTAFLTNPTNCSQGPLRITLRARSWQDPQRFVSAFVTTDTNGNPTAVTGCERVPFDPVITVQPTSTRPDSPTGLEVELSMPTEGLINPTGLAQAYLKRARVMLPEGMTISPSSADGLAPCDDGQLRLGLDGAASCPDAARIGSVTIDTPLLSEQLEGGVFLRPQASGDPASGEMFRIAIVVSHEQRGIHIKLAGRVSADPHSGRLVATFDDNPQLPFSRLRLRLKDGPRAPLATPASCGPKTVVSELTSWSAVDPDNPTPAETVVQASSFSIDCPGAQGFSPSLSAGSLLAVGGAFSPFLARIDRADGQQYLSGVTLELPPGLIAKLKDVALCPSAAASAGSCPAGSRIGTATVAAGPGTSPFFVQGQVYLTEGYKGGPYGLAVHVHAKAGPFDLGIVRVRQAIYVDPVTAELTVVSDPLPQIVGGVPVRLRSVNVDVDRPEFTINPTSCSQKPLRSTLTSAAGASHSTEVPFQVANCATLPLRPRLALRLTGRRQTRDGSHPGLRAVLTQPSGQANLEQVAVRLPLSLALDPDNAQSLCEYEDGLRVDCPQESIIGQATAITPVLPNPLTGPVYFVKGVRIHPKTGAQIRTLPTLLIPLRGEVAIDLRATSSVKRGKLINTFEAIPDAPVSRFALRLKGGKHGILVVTGDRNLCRGRHVAEVEIDGHNGKRRDFSSRMRTPCRAKRKARLKVGKVSWSGDRVTVRGHIARAAKRKVRVSVRCDDTRASRRTDPNGRGWWKTTLAARCAAASTARIVARYAGGPKVRKSRAARIVRTSD